MRFSLYLFILVIFFSFSALFAEIKGSNRVRASKNKNAVLEATHWTFAKVKIYGSLVGKDRFLHHYSLEPGQIFDEAQHTHSLATIENELKSEGYLDAQIAATKNYDTKNKSVLITLTLNPGTLFKIQAASLDLKGVPHAEKEKLLERLQNLIIKDLVHQNASKEMIEGEARKIQAHLLGEGYIQSKVLLTTTRTSKGMVNLAYSVKVSQKERYRFEGNEFFSSESLMQELFIADSPTISIPGDILVEDIAALYKKKGFYKVAVHERKGRTYTSFIILEGPRLSLKRVSVQGAPRETNKLLEKVLSEVSRLTFYDEEIIRQAISNLSVEFAQLGYWSAQIKARECKPKGKSNAADLVFEVISGERTVITGIDIKGYSELLQQEPFSSILLSLPQPISMLSIEIQRKWLLNHFRQGGYLHATVRHELKPVKKKETPGNDSLNVLIWHIDTRGGPVRFGKTTVAGLHKMKPHIVLRELHYKEGDVWNKEKIEQSLKRLRGLGMFESVSAEQRASDITSGQAEKLEQAEPLSLTYQPLVIKCIEEDPFEIRTRFGLQFVSKSFTHISWSTYKLGGSFVWKNPSGIADQLRLDADFTRFTRNLAASYEVPWIGPCPLKTLFSVYSNRFDQPLSTHRQHRLYKEAHDGLSITFNHLHPWWQSNVMVGFEVNKLFGISKELAKVIQFEPVLIDQNTPYLYIEPSITIEKMDNKADPCLGFLTFISLKAMVPPGLKDGAFVRALFEQSLYAPLFFNVVGALRLRFGHIFNARFSTILPTERFYLGGATTLRGYETNMAPPLNDLECSHKCLWVPVGGKSMVNINAEIRFPIYRPVSGVIFTDMGVLAQDKFADIAADKWLGATGFGLRCATPVGPLRFDIGWKWKKRRPQDDSFAWFVTLGHAF